MTKYYILPLLTLTLAFSVQCLTAAENPSTAAPGKKSNATAPGDTSPKVPLDKQSRKKVERAHHLAEKTANKEFLNSPHGIAFKKQIESLDQEINAVYEKYLNVFREDAATEKGEKLCEERDRQIQLLNQKQKKIEGDYETLKNSSPAYQAMVEKHLKEQLIQLKGKLKTQAPEQEDGNK